MSTDYDMQPRTPLHPEAGEELLENGVDLDRLKNSQSDIELDLNPELSDDYTDTENYSKMINDTNNVNQGDNNSNQGHEKKQHQQPINQNPTIATHESDSDDDESVVFEDVIDRSSKRKLELAMQYEDIQPSATVGEPTIQTDDGQIYLKSDSIFGKNPIEFTSEEKSDVIDYAESEILRIQRRIIQSFNDSVSNENGYASLQDLLLDLNKLTDFLWFTIKTSQFKDIKIPDSSNMLYYSGQYLIKIAGDFVDFLSKFEISQYLQNVIIYIKKLDLIFSKIMNDINGFDATERVRISSITERTRILVVTKTIEEDNDDYKFEIGRLYENTIESINGDEFT